MPLNDWPSWILQCLLPVLESWFVGLVLGPSQHDLANGIAATDQIVVTHLQITIRWTTGKIEPYRDVESHFLHIHLVDDEHEGLVPVRVQVAALHARLLLLSNSLVLCIKELQLDVRVGCASDVHLLQLTRLQHSHWKTELLRTILEYQLTAHQ